MSRNEKTGRRLGIRRSMVTVTALAALPLAGAIFVPAPAHAATAANASITKSGFASSAKTALLGDVLGDSSSSTDSSGSSLALGSVVGDTLALGTSDASGAVLGDVGSDVAALGSSAATGSLSGDVASLGDVLGTDIATGDLVGDVASLGDALGTDIATGDLVGDVASLGDVLGTDIATGDLVGDVASLGDALGTDIATGSLTGDLLGTDIATGSVTGDLLGTSLVLGDTSALGDLLGDLPIGLPNVPLVGFIQIDKQADTTEITHVGQQVHYTYTVTNAGVTGLLASLIKVHVNDTTAKSSDIKCVALTEPAGDCSGKTGNDDINLKPGQVATYNATYTVTEDDYKNPTNILQSTATTDAVLKVLVELSPVDLYVDDNVTLKLPITHAGGDNNATGDTTATGETNATGDTTATGETNATGDTTATGETNATGDSNGNDGAALSLSKAARQRIVSGTGSPIDYTFTVTNTGTVPLSDIGIDETGFTGFGPLSAVTCPTGTVTPGGVVTCTASYRTVNADLFTSAIVNTATAHATPVIGGSGTSVRGAAAGTLVSSKPSIAVVAVANAAALASYGTNSGTNNGGGASVATGGTTATGAELPVLPALALLAGLVALAAVTPKLRPFWKNIITNIQSR